MLPAEEHSLDEVTEAPEQEVESISAEFDAHLRERLLPVIRRIYEDIASVAQLSKEEEQALIDLLYEQQTEIFASDEDPVSSLEEAVAYREMLARHRDEIAALLGSSKAEAVLEYQKSIGARFEVEDLRRRLEEAGMPIPDEQRRKLIKVAIEKGAYASMPEFTGADSEEAILQELLARSEIRDQRMLQVARAVLRPSQVIWYEEFLQQRHDSMESALRAGDNAR